MNCPACASRLEERTFDDVRLDVCAHGCGGVWFDQFEFRKLDEPHEAGAAGLLELEAAAAYFDEVFGPQLAAMRAESEAARDRPTRFAHALRFITPSYYIPGDQEWGAY